MLNNEPSQPTNPAVARKPEDLSERLTFALRYIAGTMGASARMIGRELIEARIAGGSNYVAVGSGVIGTLRKRGLIWSRDKGLWRLTGSGRVVHEAITSRPVPEVCAEDFDRILECKDVRQEPSAALLSATKRYQERLETAPTDGAYGTKLGAEHRPFAKQQRVSHASGEGRDGVSGELVQVYFCDGTVPNLSRGWYWRYSIGPGFYGPPSRAFETYDAAYQDALLRAARGTHPDSTEKTDG